MPLEEAVATRRSMRDFTPQPIGEADLAQLLWACQGATEEDGRGRAAPSAGGTYPLEVYTVSAAGLARYLPGVHALDVLGAADLREPLAEAAGGQRHVAEAAAVVVIAADVGRTEAVYGARAERYVHLEAGHAAQNLLLQAAALGLGAVPVGAFDDAGVAAVIGLPAAQAPLYLIPVGHPAGG
jgi:SagB-type dehydrogenase family enzyme